GVVIVGQVEVERVERGAGFQERKEARQGAPATVDELAGGRRGAEIRRLPPRGEGAIGALVVVQRQADLLEVVGALGAPGGLARRLGGGQQKGDQDRDDGGPPPEVGPRGARSEG